MSALLVCNLSVEKPALRCTPVQISASRVFSSIDFDHNFLPFQAIIGSYSVPALMLLSAMIFILCGFSSSPRKSPTCELPSGGCQLVLTHFFATIESHPSSYGKQIQLVTRSSSAPLI